MVAFVGTPTSAAAASAAALSLTKPGGLADGELLYAATMFRNSPVDAATTAVAPAGYTLLDPHLENNGQNEAWRKGIASAAAETATSYSFTTTQGSNRCCGLLARVSGVNLGSPVDASAAAATSGLTATAISTVTPGAVLIMYAVVHVSGTPALDLTCGGMTRVGQVQVNGTNASCLAIFAEPRSAAGPTGTRTVTVAGGTPTSSTVWLHSLAPLSGAFGAPTGLASVDVANGANRDIQLSWNAVSGATGYQVERDGIVIASPVGASYTDSARPPTTFSSYRVRATA